MRESVLKTRHEVVCCVASSAHKFVPRRSMKPRSCCCWNGRCMTRIHDLSGNILLYYGVRGCELMENISLSLVISSCRLFLCIYLSTETSNFSFLMVQETNYSCKTAIKCRRTSHHADYFYVYLSTKTSNFSFFTVQATTNDSSKTAIMSKIRMC